MDTSHTQPPAPSYIGHVKNGVIVLDGKAPLTEGQTVRVEPLDQRAGGEQAEDWAESIRELRRLFDEWTDEDGRLPDENTDRLQEALDQSRGLTLQSPHFV
jgi:hypothetical protein